jgi:hypothetical protein
VTGCAVAVAAYAAFLAVLAWFGRRLRIFRDRHGAPH